MVLIPHDICSAETEIKVNISKSESRFNSY